MTTEGNNPDRFGCQALGYSAALQAQLDGLVTSEECVGVLHINGEKLPVVLTAEMAREILTSPDYEKTGMKTWQKALKHSAISIAAASAPTNPAAMKNAVSKRKSAASRLFSTICPFELLVALREFFLDIYCEFFFPEVEIDCHSYATQMTETEFLKTLGLRWTSPGRWEEIPASQISPELDKANDRLLRIIRETFNSSHEELRALSGFLSSAIAAPAALAGWMRVAMSRELAVNQTPSAAFLKGQMGRFLWLYPPAWLLLRRCKTNSMRWADVGLAEGCAVAVSPYVLHRRNPLPHGSASEPSTKQSRSFTFGKGDHRCPFSALGMEAVFQLCHCWTTLPNIAPCTRIAHPLFLTTLLPWSPTRY